MLVIAMSRGASCDDRSRWLEVGYGHSDGIDSDSP